MHQRYGEVASRLAVDVAEYDSEPEGIEELEQVAVEQAEENARQQDGGQVAKAAGADMKDIASTTVGTYPDEQKAAIQHMLGTDQAIASYEADSVADNAYA